MKLNKKGFAISTMLYGIVFVAIAVFYMIIALVSNRNTNNNNFVDEIRDELKEHRTNEATLSCIEGRVFNGTNQVLAETFKATITENATARDFGTYQVTAIADDGYAFADGSRTQTKECKIAKTTIFANCRIKLLNPATGIASSARRYPLSRIINFSCPGNYPLSPFFVDIKFYGKRSTSPTRRELGTITVSSVGSWNQFLNLSLTGTLPRGTTFNRGAIITIKVNPDDTLNLDPETITDEINATYRIR